MINIFQPTVGEDELAAVQEVFDSAWLGRGERTKRFERAFAAHIGAGPEHVVSTNSCTEALFLAVRLLGIGTGDDVVLPTVNWVGAANAVAASGARPVFCDVDPRALNPTTDHVDEALTDRTRAVLLLHYGGHPGHVAEIAALCRERGLRLIEDTACAVASRVRGTACGTFGDIGVWSFDAMKILVTGDGGMLYARDPELASRADRDTYLGLKERSGLDRARSDASRWWDIDVSTFARRSIMNDLAAAVGTVQLRRLGEFVERRRAVVEQYDRGFADVEGITCPPPLPEDHESSHYLYWVQLRDGPSRDRLAHHLYRQGVYTTFRYPLLHRIAAYDSGASLPGAEHAAEVTLCLPLHQALSDSDVAEVVRLVREHAAHDVALASTGEGLR
ncbi:DegT/DnrJ/EryC1/StrS family aminotransferase [Actinopolyspora mortivallis]|uniref:DegT/DnrJ/EryC1/StrS family aminotransferase n=1 Tax=Actinopolyspora mortivallis TaxID=33906 RepID=A0A2T0GYQ3_ACTMO|nr:DegT/DnrJ/EryC1/StrS family aminotransferase [Actinopolyspora mortivallis]PRW64248.1 DegT/DnrJ/EryC1/StrS family aminotransferase [Actinopolyspora mortivallis]